MKLTELLGLNLIYSVTVGPQVDYWVLQGRMLVFFLFFFNGFFFQRKYDLIHVFPVKCLDLSFFFFFLKKEQL